MIWIRLRYVAVMEDNNPVENMVPGFESQPNHDGTLVEDMNSTEFAGWLDGLDIGSEPLDSAEVEALPENRGSESEGPANYSDDSEFESETGEDEVGLIVNTIATLDGIGTFMSEVLHIRYLKQNEF